MHDTIAHLSLNADTRAALAAFASAAVTHPEVVGVLLYGSALWSPTPGDLDFVIVLAKPEPLRFYGVHHANSVRCEVEYITPPVLREYVSHPHWRAHDWHLDVGAKYVHSLILSDRDGLLVTFRQQITGTEGLVARRYLFVNRLGHAASRLAKLRARPADDPANDALVADFVAAFGAAAHHARLTYPRQAHTSHGWSLTDDERRDLVAPRWTEAKAALLNAVEREGIGRLGLDALVANCADAAQLLAHLPAYHLVDYQGLERLLRLLRPDLHVPRDLYMPSLGEPLAGAGDV